MLTLLCTTEYVSRCVCVCVSLTCEIQDMDERCMVMDAATS